MFRSIIVSHIPDIDPRATPGSPDSKNWQTCSEWKNILALTYRFSKLVFGWVGIFNKIWRYNMYRDLPNRAWILARPYHPRLGKDFVDQFLLLPPLPDGTISAAGALGVARLRSPTAQAQGGQSRQTRIKGKGGSSVKRGPLKPCRESRNERRVHVVGEFLVSSSPVICITGPQNAFLLCSSADILFCPGERPVASRE